MIYIVHDWEWAKAEREFLRALDLNPRYLRNLLCYGLFYLSYAQNSALWLRSELRLPRTLVSFR